MTQFYWWLLTGILFFAASMHAWLWWCMLAAIVCMLAAARCSALRAVIIGSIFVGTTKAAGGTFWFWDTYPIDWLGIESPMFQIALIAFQWVCYSFTTGLGFLIVGLVAYVTIRQRIGWWLFIPPAFVVSEVAGSFLFSLFILGVGSVPNIGFSFGYAGYAFSYVPGALAVVHLGGVYVLSMLAALSGVALYALFCPTSRVRMFGIVLATIVLAVLAGAAIADATRTDLQQESTPQRVLGITTNLPLPLLVSEEGFDAQRNAVSAAVDAALRFDPDLIVLPEGASLSNLLGSDANILAFFRTNGAPVVIGSGPVETSAPERVFRARIFDASRNRVYEADKQYLVPLGEYMPYIPGIIMTLFGQTELRSKMEEQGYVPGPLHGYADVPDDIPSVLLCFESIAPSGMARTLSGRHTKRVVHLASHSWFHGAPMVARHLDRMMRVASVANGTTVIEVGNMTGSRMYLPDGTVREGVVRASGERWRVYEYNW